MQQQHQKQQSSIFTLDKMKKQKKKTLKLAKTEHKKVGPLMGSRRKCAAQYYVTNINEIAKLIDCHFR